MDKFKIEGTCTGRFRSEDPKIIEFAHRPNVDLEAVKCLVRGFVDCIRAAAEDQIAIDIETNPYMCVDCGTDTWNSGVKLEDGSTICHNCKEKRGGLGS